MAVSTTQSIWRSGGGDNTRQAYCGTGVMAAGFYVANAAVLWQRCSCFWLRLLNLFFQQTLLSRR
jgi:hypothetical protein